MITQATSHSSTCAKDARTKFYYIPRGGLFEWVSGANAFGEWAAGLRGPVGFGRAPLAYPVGDAVAACLNRKACQQDFSLISI